MSNLTYTLKQDKIRIKQITMEGEFCASNKTRYFISIPQDTGRQLTHFELACMQLQKKITNKKGV